MSSTTTSAALLAVHLGRLKDQGRIRPEQISVGKLNNVREALAIARECRTILGANGISLEYSPLRHANDLESVLRTRARARSTPWPSARPSPAEPLTADELHASPEQFDSLCEAE